MTRSIYEEQTRRSLLATAYLQSYQDSLTYSTDELEADLSGEPDRLRSGRLCVCPRQRRRS